MSAAVFDLNEYDFKLALKKIKKAIIPVGSLEQHGAHLPLSTDSIIAEYIARKIAEQVGAFLMPTLTYGISFEHKPMFNVSLRSSTLSAMICDASLSLAESGIKQIIILNGHHGNTGALQYIPQELDNRIYSDVNIHAIHYWQMMRSEFDHAGEVETSLILAISPELVRMDRAKPSSKKLSKSKFAYTCITNAPGAFPKLTGNGVWGDPRKATATKGEKMIKEITINASNTIAEFC
jgi:creatinine amidohydrolase